MGEGAGADVDSGVDSEKEDIGAMRTHWSGFVRRDREGAVVKTDKSKL